MFEEIARTVGMSAALTTGLTLLVGVAYRVGKLIYKTAKYAEHAHDTIKRVDELVERQFTNNGGSSMLDMVQDIQKTVNGLDGRVIKIEKIVFPPITDGK